MCIPSRRAFGGLYKGEPRLRLWLGHAQTRCSDGSRGPTPAGNAFPTCGCHAPLSADSPHPAVLSLTKFSNELVDHTLSDQVHGVEPLWRLRRTSGAHDKMDEADRGTQRSSTMPSRRTSGPRSRPLSISSQLRRRVKLRRRVHQGADLREATMGELIGGEANLEPKEAHLARSRQAP